ncbi:DUF368 domain-containing protein [Draconibacterium orientale]|uniref:DUF368 domain-containing protein n=1 Tax=Draconibacterium orientale TaxID=1168034 RepID=UPI002ABE3E7E|nr:DUF368 domain-containing protein [Draconibacterium orientale]
MNRSTKDYFTLILKGMGMGAADVVPGVSGGTIAFITGIYEELINSIKSINLTAIKLLLSFKLAEFWKAINGTFLISVFIGVGISVFSLAKGLEYLLHHYPILVWSFFFGLIVASAIYVARSIKRWKADTIIGGLAGIVIAYMITVISPAEVENPSYWFIFISGMIAICAMILPGISGSFILVLLGMYKFILGEVGDLNFVVIGIFMVGAAIGIIAFSNVLSWLLKKYHNTTIALLAGFMVGSLNKVWPWKEEASEIDLGRNILPGTYEQITGHEAWLLGAIVLAIAGFALIFVVEGIGKKLKK